MDAPISDHSSNHSLPKSEIKAVLSVPPLKVTEPRQIHRVSITTQKEITIITKGCYQTVLYYQKVNEEEESGGWFLAGWIRESLGRALLEEPILCGRVQRKEEEHDFLEIVSNDSGMRLYEAIFPMNLSEFLELSDEKKENLEGELVFWKEIDEQSPQYSPLFYVQVTKFECGGYSIGISISLLLADIIIIKNFLKKWSEIHINLLPQIQNKENKTPIFYHPLLINEPPISSLITPTPRKNGSPNTALFKITSKELTFTMELWKELALLCVEKAEQLIMVNTKKVILGSDFSLIVKDSYGVIKIEGFSKRVSGNIDEKILGLKGQIVSANWSYFGDFDDVAFHEGNKPKLVSNWIGSVSDGIVIAFPLQEENVSALVIVSLPQ